MLPVVEYKGSVPMKVGKGNTTIPTLEIVKFVPRPAELMEGQPPQAAQEAAPVAAAAPAPSVSEF